MPADRVVLVKWAHLEELRQRKNRYVVTTCPLETALFLLAVRKIKTLLIKTQELARARQIRIEHTIDQIVIPTAQADQQDNQV